MPRKQKQRRAPAPYKIKRSPFYQYDFRVNGERFFGSTETDDREKAIEHVEGLWLAARERLKSGSVDTTINTVGQVFAKYLEEVIDPESGWFRACVSHIKTILISVGEDTDWSEVGNPHVNKFVQDRKAMGCFRWLKDGSQRKWSDDVDNGTINRALGVWQAAHTRARDTWEYKTRGVAWKDHKLQEADERVRAITQPEFVKVMAALPEHILEAAFFSIFSGARQNEAFTLTWGRVNLEAAKCDVITKRKRGQKVRTREIKLHSQVVGLLRRIRPADARPDDLVFNTKNWRRIWEAAKVTAGIQDFRWHDMRHTFATWAGEHGASIQEVSKALGHSKISVTQKYLHVFGNQIAKAVEGIPPLMIDGTKHQDELPRQKIAGAKK